VFGLAFELIEVFIKGAIAMAYLALLAVIRARLEGRVGRSGVLLASAEGDD